MSATIDNSGHTKVYTTPEGQVAIEQSKQSVVILSADQIMAVIQELRTCYDYCASWKDAPPDKAGGPDDAS
jgi:hypothetical protein